MRWRPTASLNRAAGGMAGLSLGLLAAAALLHATGVTAWPFELLHHFVPHLTVVAAVLALVLLLTGRRRMAVPAVVIAGFFGLGWASAPIGSAPPSPHSASAQGAGDTRSLTLLTHNLFVLNRQRDAFVAWLASAPADVVVLQELHPLLIKRLHRAEDGYPWRLIAEDVFDGQTRRSSEAIAVLSRYPIIDEQRLAPWAKGWQAAMARLELPGEVRPWIVVVHAPSPLRAENLRQRDLILQRLAPVVAALEAPVIVLGDFNASPFTPAFRAFAIAAGLTSSRTFPATFPARVGPLGVAIDHVLVRGADLLRLQVLPARGSDHRALAATVALPPSP